MDSPQIRPAFRRLATGLGVVLLVIGGFELIVGAPFWDVALPGISSGVIFLSIGRGGK
jgi:hypothetical protein